MKKRRYLVLLVNVMTLAMMLTGCGASSTDSVKNSSAMMAESVTMDYNYGYDSMIMEEAVEYEMPAEAKGTEVSEETGESLSDRKLIKTVDMTVETKEFDSFISTLETRVAQLGGYIESMETYNGSAYSGYRSSRDASMTIRIPQDNLNGFLNEVSDICNIIRRSENVKDVTLTYVDLESHKKVLQAEQERLLELIERAEYIEDIITIENRLSDVRYQIESMEAQLRTYDNRVNYSTVELYIEEVQELTPVVEQTALERMGEGFVESVEDILDGLKEFVIWFIVNIPYFILWIIIIVIIIMIIKGLKKVFKWGKKKNKNTVTVAPGSMIASKEQSQQEQK